MSYGHRTYAGDPHWISVRFPFTCKCGKPVPVKSKAWFWKSGQLECVLCGEVSEARFHAEAQDEDFLAGYA